MAHTASTPSTDPVQRRAALAGAANPAPRLDYRVTLSARLPAGAGPVGGARVTIDYVPDRLLLDPTAFTHYINGLGTMPWAGVEALGVAILDDMNNEVVPRWVRITVRAGATAGAAHDVHRVILEDRQPQWDDEPRTANGAAIARPARRG